MAFPNRLLALAGCAVIAAACTQDTTTAPPVAADVIAEGGTLPPTEPGYEGGTITWAASRNSEYCLFKVALKNLFNDPNSEDDYYQIMWGGDKPEYSTGAVFWGYEISRRGTIRAQWDVYQSLLTQNIWLVHFPHATTPVADADAFTPINSANFKLVNRCF